MDIKAFAKSDEIPSMPVQDIKEKSKCRRLRLTKGKNSIILKELALRPNFSIINVHLVDINVFAKCIDLIIAFSRY